VCYTVFDGLLCHRPSGLEIISVVLYSCRHGPSTPVPWQFTRAHCLLLPFLLVLERFLASTLHIDIGISWATFLGQYSFLPLSRRISPITPGHHHARCPVDLGFMFPSFTETLGPVRYSPQTPPLPPNLWPPHNFRAGGIVNQLTVTERSPHVASIAGAPAHWLH